MSAPLAPSFFAGAAAVAQLTALRTVRGRKLRAALLATLVVLLFPAVIALFGENAEPKDIVRGGIDWGFFRLLVFLLPVLFSAGAIGEEVEGRTFHFLASRPVSRAAIALGKYSVGASAALAVLWVGILVLHVIGFATSPAAMIDELGATARAAGAASLLVLTYSGICLFWSAMAPRAAGMLSVLWLGIVEWFGGLIPSYARFVSMNHFARALGGLEPAGWAYWLPDVELWVCAVVLTAAGALFTGLALLTVRVSELGRP